MRVVTRFLLSIFVATLIVQATGISKSFAECPPNCDPVQPPPKDKP